MKTRVDPLQLIAKELYKLPGDTRLHALCCELAGINDEEYVRVISHVMGINRATPAEMVQDAFLAGAVLAKRRMTQ